MTDLGRQGFAPEKIALLRFSQGGSLALEYPARNAKPYGAVIGLSAGLIGPEGTPRNYSGSLSGTRIVLVSSDVDGHIPLARVNELVHVLGALGGDVIKRVYPGMGHTINDDEIAQVRAPLATMLHPELTTTN